MYTLVYFRVESAGERLRYIEWHAWNALKEQNLQRTVIMTKNSDHYAVAFQQDVDPQSQTWI